MAQWLGRGPKQFRSFRAEVSHADGLSYSPQRKPFWSLGAEGKRNCTRLDMARRQDTPPLHCGQSHPTLSVTPPAQWRSLLGLAPAIKTNSPIVVAGRGLSLYEGGCGLLARLLMWQFAQSCPENELPKHAYSISVYREMLHVC